MPLFDIEAMVVNEVCRAREAEKKMREFLNSGKIEEWCARHPNAVDSVKSNTVNDSIQEIENYYGILNALLNGYLDVRSIKDFDKWEEHIKEVCDIAMRGEDKAESAHKKEEQT